MKKFLKLSIFSILLLLLMTGPVKALTVWNYEDWKDGNNYGTKTKISANITNLKGENEESDGMKVGPYNKASKAKLSDGITEEVYVGLDKDNYQNGDLFELSIALNAQEAQKEPKYLTEAVVMTQKSGDNFVIIANWDKNDGPIATIDSNDVYTYKWEFKKTSDNKLQVKFTILNYGKEIGTTGFVELEVANVEKATDVRYLWACNIKANYGVDIYTTLPSKASNTEESPETSDTNILFYFSLAIASGLCLFYIKKSCLNFKS